MTYFRLLFPDDPATGGAPNPHHVPSIPQGDLDFLSVAKFVGEKWKDTPAITLLWTNEVDFNDSVHQYDLALNGRLSTGSFRPLQTQTLHQMDDSINEGVREVKNYIEKKYHTANAPAHFPQFGIVMEHDTWQLPRDRDHRKAALQLMKDAIAAEGFDLEEYGRDFWTDTLDSYKLAHETAGHTDGGVSSMVAIKNNLKAGITKAMSSLRFVLRGNYPDTWKAIYREWGWQKEKY